mmetsp:Transcript_34825/g.85205  ORF Transcript_34825/g.85205 Transcript_34825/m.85205 type:complete len:350 (+) Transcript_34825:81-1130(+)
MEGIILGLCNPLLDISGSVEGDLLEKYGLEANNAILAEEKHVPLYAELEAGYPVEYTAGGAGQNSVRVAQWMLQQPGATSYFGAIGEDDFGKKMTDGATKDGVNVSYLHNPEVATGTCAVLITDSGKNRSLVANLAAANTYKVDHMKDPANWALVEKAQYFYITGFFFTVSPESIMTLGNHALETGKTLCMNLSAPFLIEVPIFFERMLEAIPYVDIYFGNETEARTLAKAMKWETEDVSEIAIKLARMPGKRSARPRTVVFTQGSDPTILAIGDSNRLWDLKSYPVIPCGPDELVDSNGAGDAFVGGFLAGMARGKDLDTCAAMANYAANVVIQRSGCTYPDKPSFEG